MGGADPFRLITATNRVSEIGPAKSLLGHFKTLQNLSSDGGSASHRGCVGGLVGQRRLVVAGGAFDQNTSPASEPLGE
jgi:hypothetical protein